VAAGQGERGILVCGSGVGASIAANKIKGVRACLCHDIYSAAQGVEHDDVNVLCLGGLIVGPALARKLVEGFLGATFIGSGRYQRRLEKVLALESQ
ncbi:MAG: RpiB/LacA/LacB family sugar-phosphate isomerase, partial [Chloroflexota bacterium]